MATLGESPQKSLPNRKKRGLAHPCDRLEPVATDRDIHASLHFCGLSPKVAIIHCKGKPLRYYPK